MAHEEFDLPQGMSDAELRHYFDLAEDLAVHKGNESITRLDDESSRRAYHRMHKLLDSIGEPPYACVIKEDRIPRDSHGQFDKPQWMYLICKELIE